MALQCPRCGKQNPKGSLWCLYCNSKLKKNLDLSEESTDTCETLDESQNEKVFSKKAIMVSEKRIVAILIPLIFLTPFALIYIYSYSPSDFLQIDLVINDDFWFEEDLLITDDGWECSITRIQEFSIEGVVLDYKTYEKYDFPYTPINIFSPMDILIGIDKILENPDEYPLSITPSNRGFFFHYMGDNPQYELYVKEHVGNHHIIPHNQEVLNMLQNITICDNITITGYLVNIHAVRQNQHYYWNTDTVVGNSKCEIVLTDSIVISD